MSNTQPSCLISDSRTCIVSSDKDTIFIIGSGSREFKKEIDAIRNVLDELGLSGYFALLSPKEKGLDAFCDKICRKIKESIFCIALLNDPIISKKEETGNQNIAKVRIPSANVYYEFGMAVAFGKNVIPIIKKGLDLPFDVQHLDFIVYENIIELKKKLKKVVVATLKKPPRKTSLANSRIIDLIYGPLYNEIIRYLSKQDKISSFNHPKYNRILTDSRYLLDTINRKLRKEIESFYKEIDEFNVVLEDSKRIIERIVQTEMNNLNFTKGYENPSISIEIKTDSSTTLPTLGQVLIRNTLPEYFLQVQGSNRIIRKIRYKINSDNMLSRNMPEDIFQNFFEICKKSVESNPRVTRLRDLEKSLLFKANALKIKLRRLCQ